MAALVTLALTISACSQATSSATGEAPLPTIGLGSDLGQNFVPGAETIRGNPSTTIDSVVMIGDSITRASLPALEAAYAQLGFDSVSIEAQDGKRTAVSFGSNSSGAAIAQFISGAQADDDHANEIWIVALGSNDINQYSDPVELAAAFDDLLAVVPTESPLIWVDTYFESQSEGAAEINAMIEDRVMQRGNATVARWSEVAADDGNLRVDGLHPRESGSVAFASKIVDTIIDFLQLG